MLTPGRAHSRPGNAPGTSLVRRPGSVDPEEMNEMEAQPDALIWNTEAFGPIWDS